MSVSFWLQNPKVLMNKKYITQVWPSASMNLEEKINAITRLVIVLTIVGFALTRSMKLIASFIVTIIILVVLYNTQKSRELTKKIKKTMTEGFTSPEYYEMTKSSYTQPTEKNPLMNVTLPQINEDPDRKPAAPAYNKAVEAEINDKVKEGLDPRLFKDLGDSIDFENSMRQFYATPSTTIPNDQKAFAEFCYGSMRSCKEGDPIQCNKKNYRYTNPSG